jgi:hypothetical protein
MIVSRRPEGLLIVRQVDHQVQCGMMAAAWGGAEFRRPEPYGPVRDAAAWHDEGWRAWETWPSTDERGAPIDFPDLDRAEHVRLYSEGIRRVAARSPAAGLLVSMHAQGLYERRLGLDGPPPPRAGRSCEIGAFLAGQEALQARIAAEFGDGPRLRSWAWAAYRLLQAWDLLSLYLLWRALPSGRAGALPAVPRAVGDPGVAIALTPTGSASCAAEPFPFRGDSVSLPAAARLIDDRPYRDDADLRRALGLAECIDLDIVVHREGLGRGPSGRVRGSSDSGR